MAAATVLGDVRPLLSNPSHDAMCTQSGNQLTYFKSRQDLARKPELFGQTIDISTSIRASLELLRISRDFGGVLRRNQEGWRGQRPHNQTTSVLHAHLAAVHAPWRSSISEAEGGAGFGWVTGRGECASSKGSRLHRGIIGIWLPFVQSTVRCEAGLSS